MPITVSGTSITFNDSTTQTTAFTGGGGTVTSVATGNGLQGGTITTSGTLSVACPTFNTVGSYVYGRTSQVDGGSYTVTAGNNITGGTGNRQFMASVATGSGDFSGGTTSLSGTWKWMGATITDNASGGSMFAIGCRVS